MKTRFLALALATCILGLLVEDLFGDQGTREESAAWYNDSRSWLDALDRINQLSTAEALGETDALVELNQLRAKGVSVSPAQNYDAISLWQRVVATALPHLAHGGAWSENSEVVDFIQNLERDLLQAIRIPKVRSPDLDSPRSGDLKVQQKAAVVYMSAAVQAF